MPSQMPGVASLRIGCARGSQPLKSPTTATERALGAQTAKRVPPPGDEVRASFSYRRVCVPSRKRYRSWPLKAGRSVTVLT